MRYIIKLMINLVFVTIALQSNGVFACTTSSGPKVVVQTQVDAYTEQFASCYAEDVKLLNLTETEPFVIGKKH